MRNFIKSARRKKIVQKKKVICKDMYNKKKTDKNAQLKIKLKIKNTNSHNDLNKNRVKRKTPTCQLQFEKEKRKQIEKKTIKKHNKRGNKTKIISTAVSNPNPTHLLLPPTR
jgi:hypothetical protein